MPLVLINGGLRHGMPTTLPSQRHGRVARANGKRRSAARRINRKESQQQMGTTYSIVRRRNRRRRNMAGAVMRGRRGRFVAKGGTVQATFSPWGGKPKKRRRRKAKGTSKPKSRRGRSKSKARSKPKRKKNPGRARRRNRRRRNSGLYLTNRRRRRRNRRSSAVAPRRRNRRRRSRSRRRRNPFGLRRRRNRRRRSSGRRRRNPFGLRRRNPGTILGTLRSIANVSTAKDVLAGTFGLSASLWGPKLAGFGLWAPLGRGYGGVATSVVSSVIAAKIMGFVSPSRARITLIGGLIGSFAGLLSAIHCGWRQQILPIESGLLACALPTMPGPSAAPGSPADMALKGGMPLAAVRAAGLPGLMGYGGHNTAGVANLLGNEAAMRRAAGVNDYVYTPGMNDYAQFSASGSSAGMDSSPESF